MGETNTQVAEELRDLAERLRDIVDEWEGGTGRGRLLGTDLAGRQYQYSLDSKVVIYPHDGDHRFRVVGVRPDEVGSPERYVDELEYRPD